MIGIYIKCSNCIDSILIDTEDYNKVIKFNWFKVKDKKGTGYFRYQTSKKTNGIQKCFPIHRLIMDFPKELVDHINRDTSDNRKTNLRKTSRLVNATNTKIYKTNKLGYRGVCKKGNRYIAQIAIEGKKIYLGSFSSVEEASLSYKKALNDYKPGMRLEDE